MLSCSAFFFFLYSPFGCCCSILWMYFFSSTSHFSSFFFYSQIKFQLNKFWIIFCSYFFRWHAQFLTDFSRKKADVILPRTTIHVEKFTSQKLGRAIWIRKKFLLFIHLLRKLFYLSNILCALKQKMSQICKCRDGCDYLIDCSVNCPVHHMGFGNVNVLKCIGMWFEWILSSFCGLWGFH